MVQTISPLNSELSRYETLANVNNNNNNYVYATPYDSNNIPPPPPPPPRSTEILKNSGLLMNNHNHLKRSVSSDSYISSSKTNIKSKIQGLRYRIGQSLSDFVKGNPKMKKYYLIAGFLFIFGFIFNLIVFDPIVEL
ncbi:hypothetical protein BLA29_012436, partial [Euroglyphus maynei]